MKIDASKIKIRSVLGSLILCAMIGAACAAPLISPEDPFSPDLGNRLAPPSLSHPLGTDQLGRCVLSRVIAGTRFSLSGAFSASAATLLIGAAVGISAALLPSPLHLLLTALIDMGLALPGLILSLVISGLMGSSFQSLVLGIAFAVWPWWARLLRDLTISAGSKEFVIAARVSGVSGMRLLVRYLLPQYKAPLLSALAIKTSWIILAFSGLSYLGLGPPPPAPEWGTMLQEGSIYMTRAPWLMLAPGGAVTLAVLALNLIGDHLNGVSEL